MQNFYKALGLACVSLPILNCSSTEPSTKQEKHLEVQAVMLVNDATKDTLAVLYNEKEVTGATSQTSFSLSKTQKIRVTLLCGNTDPIAASALKECDLHELGEEKEKEEDHDHEAEEKEHADEHGHEAEEKEHADEHGHEDEEKEHADEHGHEDEEHEESSFSLVASLASTDVASITVDKHNFFITIEPKKSGSVALDVQVNHGDHADVTGKVFTLTVP